MHQVDMLWALKYTYAYIFCTHVIHGGVEDIKLTFVLGPWHAHMASKVCRSCVSMYSKIYDQPERGIEIK